MSEQNIIAIICDCDGTLCPDTTEGLVRKLGCDPKKFWNTVYQLVKDGWDPPLAYLNKLIESSKEVKIPLTLDLLREVAEEIDFFPGALDFVIRLQKRLDDNPDYRDAGIRIEFTIISGGIEEILKYSKLSQIAKQIYGCSFASDSKGIIIGIKRVVSFTEKTKFIFAVNKGINAEELLRKPYRVNDNIDPEQRRVPINHMIYIGDGPSDIPCFSLIKDYEGNVIGVMAPEDKELRKPYELSEGKRLTIGPYTADYKDGTDLYKMLSRYVDGIANKILAEQAERIRPAPTH
jgi:2-hydroxy-3-keto-5-methylthiopentenyl-1-phosphate phosphatase